MASNPKTPYGPKSQVQYADPGYQSDGKARYPLDTEAHCRAAWSYIHMPRNRSMYTSDQLDRIEARIKAAGKRYGITFSDSTRSAPLENAFYARSWALEGIEIMRTGDGRTVEAYATPFDVLTEIRDEYGHYQERIARTAFNRTLSHGIDRVNVFYHHGLTLHGTPSELGSVPLGRPLEITPDGRGLRTITRYNKTQLADSVLESIRNGDIRGYSFRGKIFQSNPPRVPRTRPNQPLPTVTRTELGLAEYGPTPTPAYEEASILAVRARPLSATPNLGPGAEDPHPASFAVHSGRLRLRLKTALRDRGM